MGNRSVGGKASAHVAWGAVGIVVVLLPFASSGSGRPLVGSNMALDEARVDGVHQAVTIEHTFCAMVGDHAVMCAKSACKNVDFSFRQMRLKLGPLRGPRAVPLSVHFHVPPAHDLFMM